MLPEPRFSPPLSIVRTVPPVGATTPRRVVIGAEKTREAVRELAPIAARGVSCSDGLNASPRTGTGPSFAFASLGSVVRLLLTATRGLAK